MKGGDFSGNNMGLETPQRKIFRARRLI